jgi:hypothetical protein
MVQTLVAIATLYGGFITNIRGLFKAVHFIDGAQLPRPIVGPRSLTRPTQNPGSILGVKPAANPVICRHQLTTG